MSYLVEKHKPIIARAQDLSYGAYSTGHAFFTRSRLQTNTISIVTSETLKISIA